MGFNEDKKEVIDQQLFEYRRELIQAYNEIKIIMIALDYPKQEINDFKKDFNCELFELIYNKKDVKYYVENIDCLREKLERIIKVNSGGCSEEKIIMNEHVKINNAEVIVNVNNAEVIVNDSKTIERDYYKIDGLEQYDIKECDDITKMMVKTYGYSSYQSICIYNINKYILRHGFKNGKDDLIKSLYFIESMLNESKKIDSKGEINFYFKVKLPYDLFRDKAIIHFILVKYGKIGYKNITLLCNILKNMFKPNYYTNYLVLYNDVQELINAY